MNVPENFQIIMNEILNDLRFCRVYLDSILGFSRSENQHLQDLVQFLKRTRGSGLRINLKKGSSDKQKVGSLATRFQAMARVSTRVKSRQSS